MMSVAFSDCNAECYYVEYYFADCRYAECLYAGCHGASASPFDVAKGVLKDKI
jgi:hypothetical protein